MLDRILARIFRIIELVIVLIICVAIIGAILSFVLSHSDPIDTKAGKIIEFINNNWKVLLIILVPLFYHPIRTFINEIDEYRGMKRSKNKSRSQVQKMPQQKD